MNIPTLPKIFVAASITLAVTAATGAEAQVPPDLPAAIICYAQSDQSWRVGYLYTVTKSGEAIYLSANGKLGAKVNADGVVMAPEDRPAALDCFGKSVADLRSSGRALEFQRAK